MKKAVLSLTIIILLLSSSEAYSATYKSKYFIIHSDLDSRYIGIIQSNIELFHKEISSGFLPKRWGKRLNVYFSKTERDTIKLLAKFGTIRKKCNATYISSYNAIFVHRKSDSGSLCGLSTVFHEIIHHFVEINFRQAPSWFNEGLACFLGEKTRYVNGSLTIGLPHPQRSLTLMKLLQRGEKIDIRALMSLSQKEFYATKGNYHKARVLFFWIHENGFLKKFLRNVKGKGYGVKILERTVRKTYKQINSELLDFIKTNCYPAAYYRKGMESETEDLKKDFLKKALEIEPGYHPARLELANFSYIAGDFNKSMTMIAPILNDAGSKQYYRAITMAGRINKHQKKYPKALECFEKAWQCAIYDQFRYETAHEIGRCYHLAGDHAKAKQWFKVFLDGNWDPDNDMERINYAKKYLSNQND